ncbi:MAG: AAA domain-containing protein [bacterium]|nr:AAA domain-containing protein [bacterium]
MSNSSGLLVKLLDYVVEQSKGTDLSAFKLTGSKDFLRFKPALAGLPGVNFDQKVEGDHIWLRVDRLQATPPPQFQNKLTQRFLIISDNPSGSAPSVNLTALNHSIALDIEALPKSEGEIAAQARRKLVDASLAEYSPLWDAWAEGEKPRRVAISLYGDLFSLKHQLESEETAKPYELVWGVGITSWRLNCEDGASRKTVDYQYPLITQSMEIAIEDQSMAILLRPRAVEPRMEFDAFAACQVLSAAEVENSCKQILARTPDRPVSPFDSGSYEHILKLAAGNLHERGQYIDGQDKPPVVSDDPVVTDAWVIIARPRSNNYLVEDIERLKNQINSGVEIPSGSLAFVTPPSEESIDFEPIAFRGLSGGGSSSGGGKPQELYFPLPYNHEQVTIVEQLERSNGITVQGPPGTGKTHTIANIVCHYLATGRKVLVTSKGEQALEVLQSKIPEEVRPLTVALISGDREGMRQFQSSIEAIIHNVSQLNADVTRTEIQRLLSAIDRAHSELAAIDKRVDDIAYTQLADVVVDDVTMRAQKMADLVINGTTRHSWFDDVLSLEPDNAPPVTAAVVAQGREARRRLGADLPYVDSRIPSSAALIPAAEIEKLHNVLVSMREIEENEANGDLLSLVTTTPDVLQAARELLAAIEVAATLTHELEQIGDTWPFELRKKCRQSDYASERKALEALFDEIQALINARAEFLIRPVEVSDAAISFSKFRDALVRGSETGKPFGMFSLGGSDVKDQINGIKIAGLTPASADDWKHVLAYANLHDRVTSFSSRWNQFAQLLSIPVISGGVQSLRNIEQITTAARKAHLLATNHDAHLPIIAERVFAKPPISQLQGTSEDLLKVKEHLRAHLTRADLAKAATMLATLQEKLVGTSGDVSDALRTFVENDLGNTQFPAERVVARYAALVSEVCRIESLANDIDVIKFLSKTFDGAGAQKLAARVSHICVGASGEDTVLPISWRDAWNWARVKSHLEKIEARDELLTLAARRRYLENGLAKLYENMVSKSAWLATKTGASPKVLSALETYKTAIRRIGQGTGPNATRHRRDAQRAMQDAQGAVPCWIMSHNKVSETLPATLGSFDLVVVDEASQSDLWSLPAVLRGKKILVVGDDKQVSPDGGFISATHIQTLKNRFLADQPYAPMLTPEKSLYDIASTVFAAHKVMLREHFRCVPAIIAYSNSFYDNFMQPLRIPKESERIDPPLVDIYVPSGYRDKKDINKPEAEAIAAEINAILSDKKFANRTLGVVSLLGPDQAKYIDTLVRERCDAAELMRRKFECGDARVFQGSERDIMFLSMVVDPKTCRALSGNMFEQRFNVAGSRARDRMYLVRSVKMSDLSQLDLRAGLLSHFSKPLESSSVDSQNLIDLCESGFEKQVYTELVDKGYRVIPQVKAGSFRIDMVVEGENDARLAIECDGDDFHGPDRWAADMNRQRVLERAGWTFWRCFASTWSMRKDEVLEELFRRLASMGIEPLGTLEMIPSLVEYREWKPVSVDESVTQDILEDILETTISEVNRLGQTRDIFETSTVNTSANAEAALRDESGRLNLSAIKDFANTHRLAIEDKREKDGYLWVSGGAPFVRKTVYAGKLEDAGFKWSDIGKSWYAM